VFVCDEDYQHYLSTLAETKKELGLAVYAYCLMTNHVHLIVDPMDQPEHLSVLMKKLSSKQTRYTNRVEGRSGTLWESRFKSSPIEADAYLLQCSRYVELNPVKAKMVKRAETWKWSSFAEKIGLRQKDWLDFDVCYLGLSETERGRQTSYRQFVEDQVSEKKDKQIHDALERCQLTGTGKFTDEIEKRMGKRIENRGPGRPEKGKKNKNRSDTFSLVMEQYGARRRSTDFRKGRRLGPKDHIIEIEKSKIKPDWMSVEDYRLAPDSVFIREFKAGGKIMVTTIHCPKYASKDELKQLYKSRWNIELDIRHIKDSMGMGVLSCKCVFFPTVNTNFSLA
jgi:putative transposase